jgi:aspartate-alanine antiporter
MMDSLNPILKAAPELALFATLALGHALGQIKLGRFSLGGVAGSLVVALAIGEWTRVVLPETLKAVCFSLFIYAVGFKSGPEFFGGLNRASIKLVLSSIVQCVVALMAIVAVARLWGFGKGYSAGIGAGSLTATAMMGTAGDALARLGLASDEMTRLNSEMAVGFALTYVFGTVGVIVFVRSIAPRMMGIDPRQAARELELELSGGNKISRPGYITPFVPVVTRAFVVTADKAADKKITELEKHFDRASIERVVRDDAVIEHGPDLVLKKGDLVGVAGRLPSVVAAGESLGDEVESKEALSFPMKMASVVITNKQIAGQTLQQVRDGFCRKEVQGVYVLSLKRQGLPLPVLPGTALRRGDVLEIAGRPVEVDQVAAALGYADPASGTSDLAYHALGIAVGTLLGLVTVAVGGIPVTLGVGGGVLVAGLCFGWWHTRYPVRGGLPGPAQWILSELGLSAFAAMVGLSAGPTALAAIREQGVALLLAGTGLTLVPLFVALYFGRFVLRLNPVVLLGALCGGQTVAAALGAVNEETESMTPVLGFTVTYAISNVLLAVWGPVLIALT